MTELTRQEKDFILKAIQITFQSARFGSINDAEAAVILARSIERKLSGDREIKKPPEGG